jgi:uncharacterized protein (TIGR03435 family)
MRAIVMPLGVFVVFASTAFAQTVFSGIVLDPNGAPVEGATIYVTSIRTSEQLDFATTAEGRFEFSGLPAGDYRVSSMTPGIGVFTVTLAAGEPVHREITLAFGPFQETWDIIRAAPGAPMPPRTMPAGWRCTNRVTGLPLCAPSSVIDEFERDETERLKAPVLGPRRIGLPPSYPPDLLEARIQGAVVLRGRLTPDGVLTAVQLTSSGHSALDAAALAAVNGVRWEPARIRGVAQEVPLTVTLRYRLDAAAPAPVVRPGGGQSTDTPVFAPGGVRQSVALQGSPAQAPAPRPTFEVASVKPNTSGAPMVSVRTLPGGGFQAINQTLRGLIQFAYGLRAFQLTGPSWIDDARFDVTATAGRMPMPGELQLMLRALLADRFKLVVRNETRESPVYNLVLTRNDGRLGPGLRPADASNCRQAVPGQPVPLAQGPGQLPPCGSMGGGRGGPFTARSVTLDQLAANFSNQVDRPVINRTGLTGLFDVTLEFSGGRGGGGLGPLPPQPGEPPPPPDDRPVLSTAIQDQLGLRFENARGPVEFTVIETVSPPTPD